MSGSDIFFSYAREDQAKITRLVTALEARGWSVFWDRRIPAGKTWRNYIGRALDEARCVVVAWSAHAVESEWVIEEADEGKSRGFWVPIFLDAVSPPRGFRGIQRRISRTGRPRAPRPRSKLWLATSLRCSARRVRTTSTATRRGSRADRGDGARHGRPRCDPSTAPPTLLATPPDVGTPQEAPADPIEGPTDTRPSTPQVGAELQAESRACATTTGGRDRFRAVGLTRIPPAGGR